MPNQIISSRPQTTNQNTPAHNQTTGYIPSFWEKQYGYVRNGVFYRPSFCIFRNDEPLDIDDDFNIGYSYEVASHIIMHLKTVSTDNFTIEPLAWTPIFNYQLMNEVVA